MKYKVALTIVNYNTKDLLFYCLKKIYQAHISLPFQIIVLDNASRDADEIEEEICSKYPEIVFLKQLQNTGYTKGVNACVKKAEAQYIFNLNTDAFIEPGIVEKMVEYLENNPSVGLISPQLLNFDGSIQESSYLFLTPLIALYRRTPIGLFPFAKKTLAHFSMVEWDHNSIKEVDWVLGAAYMFPKGVVEEIGYLDEDMFLYLSDTYFAWQVWSIGKKVVYYPEVQMYHYHRKSSQNGIFLQLLFRKAYWIHIQDGIKFFLKTWLRPNPHQLT
jgi:GT2 family glycosyltransferase